MAERIMNLKGTFFVILLGLGIILITLATPVASPAASTPMAAPKAAGPCGDKAKRYADCGNGTVTDTVTGLIWLKELNCLPSANWEAAKKAAAGLKDGDCMLKDGSSPGEWRLPTQPEWEATMKDAKAQGCSGP